MRGTGDDGDEGGMEATLSVQHIGRIIDKFLNVI